MLDIRTAEHEAAHLVVGCALGLSLARATTNPSVLNGSEVLGYTWFRGPEPANLAYCVMYCAGIVWEERPGGELFSARLDLRLAKEFAKTKHDLNTAKRLAREILDGRRRIHARIASELCDRDLTSRDVEALVLGL